MHLSNVQKFLGDSLHPLVNHVQYILSNFNGSSLNTPIYSSFLFQPEKGAEGEGKGYPETTQNTHTHMVKNKPKFSSNNCLRGLLNLRCQAGIARNFTVASTPCTRRMSTFRGTKAFFLLGRQRSPGPACNAVCHATAVTWGTWH